MIKIYLLAIGALYFFLFAKANTLYFDSFSRHTFHSFNGCTVESSLYNYLIFNLISLDDQGISLKVGRHGASLNNVNSWLIGGWIFEVLQDLLDQFI